MNGGEALLRGLLAEETDLLSQLEAMTARLEQRGLSAAPADRAGVEEGGGGMLLTRLQAIRGALADDVAEGLLRGGQLGEVARQNQERARALAQRTSDLLGVFQTQRAEILKALGDVREGRRLAESWTAGKLSGAGLDFRR